ncbi:hypothetical protein [Oceaniferula marina]|nr:hypothetical protein [Oceaniferula marina]
MSDALFKVVDEKKIASDAFDDRVSQLVKQRKLTELARFKCKLGFKTKNMEKPAGGIRIREINETIPMGIFLEAEATAMENGHAVHLRYSLDFREELNKRRYYSKNIMSATTITDRGWSVLHHWKNSSESTILLVRMQSSIKPTALETPEHDRAVHTDVELREVSPFDLAKFSKSTPATRAKALTWLRGRSRLLSGTTVTTHSGEKSVHQDQLQCLHNKNGWDTAYLGFLIECEPLIWPNKDKVDFKINAEWQDPKVFKEAPDYKFTLAETIPANQSLLLEPSTSPKKSKSALFLILTPRVQEGSTKIPSPPDVSTLPSGKSSVTYAISPSFMRILGKKSPTKSYLSCQELLTLHGMSFPEETFANYIAADGTVILHHNQDGHRTFRKILKDNKLLP